ncbi:MAG: hypothetical protein VKL41_01305 [Snowella sp.]|jgi:hypothetical protein|nr:hypothetical protein [Snowella sp.]
MDTITIPVENELAEAYRQADQQQRQKIETLLNIALKKAVNPKPLLTIMQEASQQAIANGMTPEILESILADE